ncbi:MAG: hypothetical protein MSH65_10730 [Spirochaetia bacterium]|nr:hypothetical protein [Treponema sp.]MCI6593102.1 hypothetical protein [Spirochaetia bacterium]
MKTLVKTLILLLFIIVLASCATTSAGDTHIEKKQGQKKLLFEDWKYKGFGQKLPDWVEAAYHNKTDKIIHFDGELNGKELLILRGEGINSDQAERNLELAESGISEEYTFFDSSWVRIDAGEYVALAIYYKETL